MSRIARLAAKFRKRMDPLSGLDEQAWLNRAKAAALLAIAVVESEWRGVYSSIANLFPCCLSVRDALTKRSAARIADLILQSGVSRVVFAELPPTYTHLLDALCKASRNIDVYSLWYNSFMMSSKRNWKSLLQVKQLAQEGKIRKIGFAKSGMAEVFNRLGVRASLVLHAIEKVPQAAAQPMEGGVHLGIAAVNLAIWRKLPFAMLAATTEIPEAVVHVAGANETVAEFCREMRINAHIQSEPIPQVDMPRHLRSMHLNLYVTLSECCPMVPLESLSEGTPCLFGPNSHLFDDSAYLHSRLVVEYPERNEVIARYIRQALTERSEIVAAYRGWAPSYWQRSQESVAAFLDAPGATIAKYRAA